MIIKILGSGCPNCAKLEANAKRALEELNLEAIVEKVTDINLIINYGVMSTPALVVDEKVLASGRFLDIKEIKEILSNQQLSKPTTENTSTKPGSCSCGSRC